MAARVAPTEELQGEQQGDQQPVVGEQPVAGAVVSIKRPEAAALDALRGLFVRIASLDGDASSVTREEFGAFCACPELRLELTSADAVFACLDVDGSGGFGLDEFLYAVAGRYMARADEMDPVEACRQVLRGLDAALAAAPGEPPSAKALKEAHVASSAVAMEGHKTGVSCCTYFLTTLVPCYVCCEDHGKAVANSKEKLVGMEQCMDYIIRCKDSGVRYVWEIQNYRYETHTYRDSEGNTKTKRVKVKTHFARTEGMLAAVDATPTFQPNLRKANVALSCELDAVVDGALRAEYDQRKHMFYATNTTDCYQDKTDTLDLPPMQKVAHVTWVDAGTPWYAGACARNLAAATCTGVCWLAAMDGYMGMQKVEFKKTCTGFLSPAPVDGPGGAGHLSIRAGPLTVQLGR